MQQYAPQQQHQQPQQQRQQRNGPRANCDQVVFEAIAKAAEIVVASRCKIDSDLASASQTGSGRFNLLVPEVKSVRNILQRWKRTMHIPLRLDVYYQHPPSENNPSGERELLERWCLEYAPTASQSHYSEEHYSLGHVDPIVQLRRVCKNIVVWLRTLYCHSRLLPAQALRKFHSIHNNNCIGFSIYVVGEGQDDVTGLLQQGFDSEPKPSAEGSSGVPTPYGVLGWRAYLAPKDLVRRLILAEQEKARLLQTQYSNTTRPMSIPMKVIQPQHSQQQQYGTNSGGAQPIARSAPTNRRDYRRINSDSVAAHSPSQQQQSSENPRYYSRSPNTRSPGALSSTLIAPRSYHPQSATFRRTIAGDNAAIQQVRGLYPNDANETATPLSTTPNNETNDSPGSKTGVAAGGINSNKNLSALSLALLSMKTETDSSPDPSETDTATAAVAELGPSEIRRAALHNAPPSAATAVGEYGYAYNNNHQGTHNNSQQQQQHQQSIHPNLSSSPASANPFKGPSTPVSSTFGTTPPGYLLSATPSVGSHGTMNLGTTPGGGGLLMPPARPSSAGPASTSAGITPPFVRPLGFAGQASTATTSQQQQSSPHAVGQHLQSPPHQLGAAATTPEEHKPSLDLLHSSPFHNSGMGSHHHQQSSPQKDGLSSFLQAEENASIEAATTFINDFYHHHYPMAQLSDDPHHHHHHHHHHMGSTEDFHHHSSGLFAESSSSAAFLDNPDGLLHQAEDMPFAVEGISSGLTPTSASQQGNSTSVLKNANLSAHEASLMAASMMVPHKKLALFGSTTDESAANEAAADDMDALTDQLADFRSFGATLASPLTTSVGSGG